jgi:hypothetical protein
VLPTFLGTDPVVFLEGYLHPEPTVDEVVEAPGRPVDGSQ